MGVGAQILPPQNLKTKTCARTCPTDLSRGLGLSGRGVYGVWGLGLCPRAALRSRAKSGLQGSSMGLRLSILKG